MNKILCFGELLLRFSPQLKGEWIHQSEMPVYIGGAELNVASALALWDIPVSYLTGLPGNYLSEEIVTSLRFKGINTDHIVYKGDRIGGYYLPQGADLKNAGVIYDRSNSAFSHLLPGEIDWEIVMKDVTWFHFSAINPALNENIVSVCKEAVAEAEKRNIFISIDLNFRSKLWQYGKQPLEVMPSLVEHADLIMGNIWAAENMIGIKLPAVLSRTKEILIEQSLRTSEEIIKRYPKCSQVANTFRFDLEQGLTYYATLYREGRLLVSSERSTTFIIDRVGSGDCFMAGLIYGNSHQYSSQELIDFAAAAAFNKLFIKGDSTTSSVEEITTKLLRYA